MECILWLLVCMIFVIQFREPEMTWYIIFRVWRKNDALQFEELDAVLCECSMDALTYAKQRYRTKYGESLRAEACLTMEHIKKAKVLANQHALDDQVANWTEADWKEFCKMPVYVGDQDKYLRTWTS